MHGHRHVFHNRAHGTQAIGCLTHFVVDIGLAVCTVETFEQDADAQTRNATAQSGCVAVDAGAVLARVQTIGTSNHFQQQSVVSHGGRHGSGMVDGGFDGHDTGVRHQAVRGFHAVNATPRGGHANRTALVTANGQVEFARAHQGG